MCLKSMQYVLHKPLHFLKLNHEGLKFNHVYTVAFYISTFPKPCSYTPSRICKNPFHVCLHVSLQYTVYPKKYAHGFALLCFVAVIHWLIFPYPSGFLHWHCGNLTIAPVPAKQPWWIWINTSCELIMNDCITTTKQSTTKPCAYFLGYTVIFVPLKFCHIVVEWTNGHSESYHKSIVSSCNKYNAFFLIFIHLRVSFSVNASIYGNIR